MCHVTVLRRSMGWIGRLASNCPFHIHLIHPNHFPFHPVPKPTFHRACDPTMLLSMLAVSSPWCYDAVAVYVMVAVDRFSLHGPHGRGIGRRTTHVDGSETVQFDGWTRARDASNVRPMAETSGTPPSVHGAPRSSPEAHHILSPSREETPRERWADPGLVPVCPTRPFL